jgi:propionate CoA-transferase
MARKRRQDVLYITERCVIQLTEAGLTVIEIAPGVDLERDVLAKADVPLLVSPNLRLMTSALFHPEPMGLILSHKPSRIARTLQHIQYRHQTAAPT